MPTDVNNTFAPTVRPSAGPLIQGASGISTPPPITPVSLPVAGVGPAPSPAPVQKQLPQEQLDPNVVALAKAIQYQETGGRSVPGQSGEAGRYQFTTDTWKGLAGSILGDPNAAMTEENENYVAYHHILDLKNKGLSPVQIASVWNSGSPDHVNDNHRGVNKYGVAYDTPAYVQGVYRNYQAFAQGKRPDGKPDVNAVQVQPNLNPTGAPAGETTVDQNPDTGITGFLKNAAKSIIRPVAEFGVTAGRAAQAAGDVVMGQGDKAAEDLYKSVNLPFLGETQTIFRPEDTLGQGVKKIIGSGLQIGALAPGVGAAGEGVAATIAGDVARGAASGAIGGGAASGLGTLGQGLSQDKSAGEIAKDTAIGTVEGAIGGAALGAGGSALVKSVRGVTGALNPDIEASLTKAIKPKNSNFNWSRDVKTTLPDLLATAGDRPIKNIDDLAQVVGEAKKKIWSDYAYLLGPNQSATVDGNKIADAMMSVIDKRFAAQNPAAVQRIVEAADSYRRPMTLGESEEFLQSANNDLYSYYAKNKVNQKVAMADPEKGYVVKEAEALRQSLYEKLGELTGKDAAALKKRYGALSNLQNEVQNRVNVAARAQPESLQEQLNYAQAAGKVVSSVWRGDIKGAAEGIAQGAAGKWLKDKSTTDALIENAFKKMRKAPPIAYPPIERSSFQPNNGGPLALPPGTGEPTKMGSGPTIYQPPSTPTEVIPAAPNGGKLGSMPPAPQTGVAQNGPIDMAEYLKGRYSASNQKAPALPPGPVTGGEQPVAAMDLSKAAIFGKGTYHPQAARVEPGTAQVAAEQAGHYAPEHKVINPVTGNQPPVIEGKIVESTPATKKVSEISIKPIKEAIKKFDQTGSADIAVGKKYGISVKDEGDYVSVRFGSNDLTPIGSEPYGEKNFATKEEAFDFAKKLQKEIGGNTIKKPPTAALPKGNPAASPSNQTLYHGTAEPFSKFDTAKMKTGNAGKGIYLTDNQNAAGYYSMAADEGKQLRSGSTDITRKKGAVMEVSLSPKAKIQEFDHIPTSEELAAAKKAKFDGVRYPDETFATTQDWDKKVLGDNYPHNSKATVVFNEDMVKIKKSTIKRPPIKK